MAPERSTEELEYKSAHAQPSDLPCPAGCREELADLQTVMVYLEREVETV